MEAACSFKTVCYHLQNYRVGKPMKPQSIFLLTLKLQNLISLMSGLDEEDYQAPGPELIRI
jgi:hypothetical protein